MPVVTIDISSDGSRVLLGVHRGTKQEVWRYDLERESLEQLTLESRHSLYPKWSPDGESLSIASSQDGYEQRPYRQPIDTSRPAEPLYDDNWLLPIDWSPDGKHLALTSTADNSTYVLSLDGRSEPVTLVPQSRNPEVPTVVYQPAFAPSGLWIAYAASLTGEMQVYVQRFPEGDRRKQVSTEGGSSPRWSPDGRALFYRHGRQVIEVVVEPSDTDLRLESPRVLFEGNYRTLTFGASFDVHPDGRFLMLRDNRSEVAEFRVVFNWFEELKRIAPTD